MRMVMMVSAVIFVATAPVMAQGKPQPRPAISPNSGATSDEKAAETRRLIDLGRARQREVEERNTRIWKRWDYAVCIGCGPMPRRVRIVYTTPARVLAGFIAADDDERVGRHL
ncbi:hypothetical protein [Methylobacterium planeticum]|uniref:Uncharacterized protein n=1 Tax=Methylobacterium planeticum TaxID=2615211 RepID=A0A6N6MSP8_9HYPH|nr:hypothetical protein [Methylobacterium planeticum]KAB1072619.1 hypothetical protein F6X51_15130 [Methylobacterium planeticum]